jgi:nicotinate-nucleotide pyrophosphorylase (carboxylating)
MAKEFAQIAWDSALEDDCRQLVRLAVREDLDRQYDWTTLAMARPDQRGRARIAVRGEGVVCGLHAAQTALDEMDIPATWQAMVEDGQSVSPHTTVAELAGSVRDLVTAERLLLNLIGRLSGIATLARRYVDAVQGTGVGIYDTRKTTPGWRRLEKYAVRCGGARNHRTGLFDAVLIKDNHLAFSGMDAGQAVARARQFLRDSVPGDTADDTMIVEVEVDTLDQLETALPQRPDIVLLDNMSLEQLRQAKAMRDRVQAGVQLEASGGVNLETVRAIAETGVDRISVGALTHAAISLDVGLDWLDTDG